MKKVVLLIIILLVIVGSIYFNSYKNIRTFDMDGYVFTSDNITKNLINGESERDKIDYSKVKYYDALYKGRGKYFIGDKKKTNVNLNYPIVSKDSKTLLILSDEFSLIDSKYRKTNSYSNTLISDNKLFNENDYERADNLTYNFVELNNGVYVNLSEMSIKTNTSKKYVIPINSFITFSEENLRYYYMSGGKYFYKEIKGLDNSSFIFFDGKELAYLDFLERLGLFIKDEENAGTEVPPVAVQEEEEEEDNINKPATVDGVEYVKPTVTFGSQSARIYSVSGKLEISDPTGRIVKYPTFEFYKGKNLVVRKTFVISDTIEVKGLYPDTDYDVVGVYHYKNEKGQEVKSEFTRFKISTKDISGLENVNFSIDKIVPYSNYAVFQGIKLNNKSSDEVLKGIKKVILKIGNNSYQLSSGYITKLLKLESQNYSTAKSLSSNTRYNVDVEFYDVAGNLLKKNAVNYSFKTIKQAPSGYLSVKSRGIDKATLSFDLTNRDNVNIANMKYVVYDNDKNIIKEGKVSDLTFTLDNLSPNEVYSVSLIGDYDLEDGNGIIKGKTIVEGKFTTEPITTLGYVKLNFDNIESDVDKISFNVSISDDTNTVLKQLLSSIKIVVKDSDDNKNVKTILLTGNDLERIKAGEALPFEILGLLSNHTYYFELSSNVELGSKNFDITTNSNVNNIKTIKYDSDVHIINRFVTSSVINFDARIEDFDKAIQSNRVLLEVRNSIGVLVLYKELNINTDYENISLEKLDKDTKYNFKFIAEEYNTGYSNDSFVSNKVLLEEDIVTEEGLSGNVEVDTLLKQITSKNIFDIDNTRRWKTGGNREPSSRKINKTENTVTLSAKNGYRTYSYYLPEYAGKTVTVSFKIKYKDKKFTKPVYLTPRGSNNSYSASDQIKNIKADDYISYSRTVVVNASSPYISFHIIEVDGENETTSIVIKDLQIEEGSSATSYVPYKAKANYMGSFFTSLTDKKHEIEEDDFHYFLRYYKNNKLIDTVEFDFNDSYQVIDAMSKHEIEPSSEYKIKLSIRKKVVGVNVEKRFYDIDTLEFTSDDEIRTIHNVDEFFQIHTSGFYLVSDDLDFSNTNRSIGTEFNGIIDFQGHKIIRDTYITSGKTSEYLFYKLGSNAVLKNIDLHVYFEYPARDYFDGIAYYNYGTIENIMATLEQSNHLGNTLVTLMIRYNYGNIKNFVVNSKDSLDVVRYGSLVCLENYGTITNGYLYGKAIDATYNNPSFGSKYVGALTYYTAANSYISNIYSLVDVNIAESSTNESYQNEVGNIAGSISRTIIRNAYTNSSGTYRNTARDVNFFSGGVNAVNLYYATKDIYSGSYSNKIAPNTLRQEEFQNILNADNAFDVENYVKYGYYPHIIWPDVMPNQEYIELPKEDDGEIDYLTIENRVEKDDETVEATLIFDNIGYSKIDDLDFYNGIKVDVLDQVNENGKSKVKVRFHDPDSFVTNYSLHNIYYVESTGKSYKREYKNSKDRIIPVEMYRNINSITDFRTINSNSTQNFKLQTDLDFSNLSDNIDKFTGKFDGNGHTIKNVRLTNKAFINNLSGGTIKNLYVENYTKDGPSYRGGFIAYASGNATIDNVHLKNINITDSDTYIGALVGEASSTLISNSSATNVHIYQKDKNNVKFYGRYGGFIGRTADTIVENCYVQDLNMEIKYGASTYGIGGFVGRHDSGFIRDSYVQGTINTNQQEVGGVVGYNSGYVERVISNVYVYTQQDSVGGVVGYSTNDNIYNTLVLGGVYTSKNAINMNRTVGNRIAVNSNYAWDEQLINGLNINSANGDIFLTSEELKSASTYDSLIKFGNQFDLSKLSNSQNRNIMPKLKYLSSNKLLPNQKDIEFYAKDFKVKDIIIDKSFSDATIQIYIQNPDNYTVKGLNIDGFNIRRVNKNVTSDGETIYEVYGTPERYYDSYLIDNITYNDGKKDVSINPSAKIELTFYKDIGTFEDWQKIDTDVYENYRLVNDIDFAGKTNVKTRVSFNRLEGTDDGHTLKNINITATSGHVGLIDTVASNISNVNFDHITIDSKSSTLYSGIIRFLNGTMSDINFTNIDIASNASRTGIVSFNQSPDIKRIKLEHVKVIGSNTSDYVGGFIGLSRYFDIAHVDGVDLEVKGRSYVGGLVGSKDGTTYPTMFNFNVDDCIVTGTGNYIGGVFGNGSATYTTVKNVDVKGVSNVGGISGNANTSYISGQIISDSKVTGSGDAIGGAFGNSNQLTYTYVDNVEVYGTRSGDVSNRVGGITGVASSYSHAYCGIRNSKIENLGNNTGGIVGQLSNATLQRNYVYNTTVTGRKYVGGLAGYHSSTNPTMYYNITNATVRATNDFAGGIIGYLDNINTTSALNKIIIYDNLIANSSITSAGIHASSIAPNSNKLPFDGHFYNNMVIADVVASVSDKSRFFIGESTKDADTFTPTANTAALRALKVYENSTYNGSSISSYNYPTNVTKITYNSLKSQDTYKPFFSTAFDYSMLDSGEFPFLKYDWNGFGYQHFELPEESVFLGNITGSIGKQTSSIPSLPTVNVYASDVNKINVEFDKVMDGIKFRINDTTYNLEQLSYSFYYDFNTDFEIVLSDGINTKTLKYKADDLRKTSSIIDNNYYHIDGDKIISNEKVSLTKVSNNTINYRVVKLVNNTENTNNSKKPINIYNDKILLENHNIYNLDKKQLIENDFDNLSLVDNVPLYSFTYGDSIIDTYYNYSLVDGNFISKQIFVSSGEIDAIDSSLENIKDSALVSKDNGKSYLIYLGDDNKLYSLKDDISLPKSFINKNIKSIATDMYGDSDIIAVNYINGDYVIFNYHNGDILKQDLKNTGSTVMSYFNSYFNNTAIVNSNHRQYQDTLNLMSKLKEKSVEKVLGSDAVNSDTQVIDDNYINIYNPTTKKYEVFKVDNINASGTSDIVNQISSNSLSNTIDNNVVLYNYYIGKQERNRTILVSVLGIVGLIIMGIISGILLLKRNLNKGI